MRKLVSFTRWRGDISDPLNEWMYLVFLEDDGSRSIVDFIGDYDRALTLEEMQGFFATGGIPEEEYRLAKRKE